MDVFSSTMAASMVARMLNDPKVFLEWPHYNQVTDLTTEKTGFKSICPFQAALEMLL